VASVFHNHFTVSVGGAGFLPGQELDLTYGPADFDQFAWVHTARPFDVAGQNRAVTQVGNPIHRTTGPGNQTVTFRVRNVGANTIFVLFLERGLIGP
jgi:hypothetical protein